MHSETTQIVSRSGGWRLRWIAAAVAAPLFGVMAAFGTARDTPEPIPRQTVVEPLDLSAALLEDAKPVSYFQEERFQRNNTASALLDRVIEDASARGASWIEGYPHNEPKGSDAGHFRGPRSMYEARGFQPIEVRKLYTVMRRPVG